MKNKENIIVELAKSFYGLIIKGKSNGEFEDKFMDGSQMKQT